MTEGDSFVCKTGSVARPSEFSQAAGLVSFAVSSSGPLSGLLFYHPAIAVLLWEQEVPRPKLRGTRHEAVGFIDQILPAPPVTDDSAFCCHLAEPFT